MLPVQQYVYLTEEGTLVLFYCFRRQMKSCYPVHCLANSCLATTSIVSVWSPEALRL